MASLYKDRKSPFWFLKYKDPATGIWRQKSTGYRHGIKTETRKADEMLAEACLSEARRSPQRDAWKTWVPDYLGTKYINQPRSLVQARKAWRVLEEYLGERKIFAPQDLDYRKCMDFVPWRKAQHVAGRPIAHNTARLELVYLGVICKEAVRRGIIDRNPAASLGISREKPKEKPELTDAHVLVIREELKKEGEWLRIAFEIAVHQGCRLSETEVFTEDVNLEREQIHHRKTKGDKPFTAPVHPALLPLLTELTVKARAEGREKLFILPGNANTQCHRFFKSLRDRIPDVTFHSTRVTVASRLAKGDVSISKAMRLLNHSSALVHKVYQRLNAADVADAFSAVNIPLSENPGAAAATPERKTE